MTPRRRAGGQVANIRRSGPRIEFDRPLQGDSSLGIWRAAPSWVAVVVALASSGRRTRARSRVRTQRLRHAGQRLLEARLGAERRRLAAARHRLPALHGVLRLRARDERRLSAELRGAKSRRRNERLRRLSRSRRSLVLDGERRPLLLSRHRRLRLRRGQRERRLSRPRLLYRLPTTTSTTCAATRR